MQTNSSSRGSWSETRDERAGQPFASSLAALFETHARMAFTGLGNYEVKVAALACTIRVRVGYVLLGDFPNVERSECAPHEYGKK